MGFQLHLSRNVLSLWAIIILTSIIGVAAGLQRKQVKREGFSTDLCSKENNEFKQDIKLNRGNVFQYGLMPVHEELRGGIQCSTSTKTSLVDNPRLRPFFADSEPLMIPQMCLKSKPDILINHFKNLSTDPNAKYHAEVHTFSASRMYGPGGMDEYIKMIVEDLNFKLKASEFTVKGQTILRRIFQNDVHVIMYQTHKLSDIDLSPIAARNESIGMAYNFSPKLAKKNSEPEEDESEFTVILVTLGCKKTADGMLENMNRTPQQLQCLMGPIQQFKTDENLCYITCRGANVDNDRRHCGCKYTEKHKCISKPSSDKPEEPFEFGVMYKLNKDHSEFRKYFDAAAAS